MSDECPYVRLPCCRTHRLPSLSIIVSCQSFGPNFAEELTTELREKYKVRMNSYGSSRLRAVTHHQVKQSEIELVIDAFTEICGAAAAKHGVDK